MSSRNVGKANGITGERTEETTEDTARGSRLDVSGTQVCASTLASVSAAAAASIFGTTGTIVGVALMSVISTTGSALYSHGLRRTGERLQTTSVAGLTRRLGPWPRAGHDPTTAAAEDAGPVATEGPAAEAEPDSGSDSASDSDSGWRGWLAERRWGVALGIAIVFVATLGVVTLIELAGQRSLADMTGGGDGRTSIGSVFGSTSNGSGDSDDEPAPGDTSTTVAPGSDPTAPEGDSEAPGDVEPGPGTPDDTTGFSDDPGTTTDSTAPDATTPGPGDGEPPPTGVQDGEPGGST